MALQQIDGEKIGAIEMPGTAIVGHLGSIAGTYIRRNGPRPRRALRLLRPTRPVFHTHRFD